MSSNGASAWSFVSFTYLSAISPSLSFSLPHSVLLVNIITLSCKAVVDRRSEAKCSPLFLSLEVNIPLCSSLMEWGQGCGQGRSGKEIFYFYGVDFLCTMQPVLANKTCMQPAILFNNYFFHQKLKTLHFFYPFFFAFNLLWNFY